MLLLLLLCTGLAILAVGMVRARWGEPQRRGGRLDPSEGGTERRVLVLPREGGGILRFAAADGSAVEIRLRLEVEGPTPADPALREWRDARIEAWVAGRLGERIVELPSAVDFRQTGTGGGMVDRLREERIPGTADRILSVTVVSP